MCQTRKEKRRATVIRELARRRTESGKQSRPDHRDPTGRTLAAVLSVTVELGNVPTDIDPDTLAATIRDRLAEWTNQPDHYESTLDTLNRAKMQVRELLRGVIQEAWTAHMRKKTPQLARHFPAACLKRWYALETTRRVPWLSIRPASLAFED